MVRMFLAAGLTILLTPVVMATQHDVAAVASVSDRLGLRSIVVACDKGAMRISLQWQAPIGTPGKYRRHLVAPGDLADTHFLLPVLPDGTSTGLVANDREARSFIGLILGNAKADDFVVEVFPEGRDPLRGDWEHAEFNLAAFSAVVDRAARQCGWNKQRPRGAGPRQVRPGTPYEDE